MDFQINMGIKLQGEGSNSGPPCWSFNMVSELGLAGGPEFEPSPCNLIPTFI